AKSKRDSCPGRGPGKKNGDEINEYTRYAGSLTQPSSDQLEQWTSPERKTTLRTPRRRISSRSCTRCAGKPAHLSGISERSSGNPGTDETTNFAASAGSSASHCSSAFICTGLMICGSAPWRLV